MRTDSNFATEFAFICEEESELLLELTVPSHLVSLNFNQHYEAKLKLLQQVSKFIAIGTSLRVTVGTTKQLPLLSLAATEYLSNSSASFDSGSPLLGFLIPHQSLFLGWKYLTACLPGDLSTTWLSAEDYYQQSRGGTPDGFGEVFAIIAQFAVFSYTRGP